MATSSADQVTLTDPNSARSDSQVARLQTSHTTTTVTANHDHEDHPQSSVAATQHEALHDQSGVMPSGNSQLDSGFGSLHVHQPNSLNYEANLGGLLSIGTDCLPSLHFEGENDDAYESLQQLQSMGEQFLSMGDFPMTGSPISMGALPTMGEFLPQLAEITESPSLSPDKIDSQAGPGSMHAMQDIVGDGPSNPFTSSSAASLSDPNELLENGRDSDENAEMNAQGQSPVRNDDPVSNPQLPSTLLSNVRSQPVEIPLRERVRQNPDYVLERVLVEEKGRSV